MLTVHMNEYKIILSRINTVNISCIAKVINPIFIEISCRNENIVEILTQICFAESNIQYDENSGFIIILTYSSLCLTAYYIMIIVNLISYFNLAFISVYYEVHQPNFIPLSLILNSFLFTNIIIFLIILLT